MVAQGQGKKDALIAEAADWLVRLDGGKADIESFEAWRAGDTRRAAAFAQVAAAWKHTGDLRHGDAAVLPEKPPPQARITRRAVLGGVAAGGVAAIAVATGGRLLFDAPTRIRTAIGERRSFRLPDGSSVELNTASEILWRFAESRRLTVVGGEIALATAADPLRPFLLTAAGLEARLDAGRYNLRLRESGPELISLSGSALVAPPGTAPVRIASMQVLASDGKGIASHAVTPDQVESLVAWRRGEILLDGMTLEHAVTEFNRYLGRRIVIADPAIRDVRLGGRFFVDDPDSFLRSLDSGFGIVSQRDADVIRLKRGA